MRKSILILIIVLYSLGNNKCFCQWVQTNGPYEGTISSLAIKDSLIIGGSPDGIYLIKGDGARWSNIQICNPKRNVRTIIVKDSKIFAATYGAGVFLSTDNGLSWIAKNNGLNNTLATDLAVSGNTLYVSIQGQGEGVYMSTNDGSSWTILAGSITQNTIFSLAAGGTNIFAGTYTGGLLLSTDNGKNWLNIGLINNNIHCLLYNFPYIYAGTDNGIYCSVYDGAHWAVWNTMNTGLTGYSINKLVMSGSNIYAAIQMGGVCLSTDNGNNWKAINNGLFDKTVYCIATNGTELYAGTGKSGLFISKDNGESWTNKGLLTTLIYSMTGNNRNIYAGSNHGVFKSADYGVTWVGLQNGFNNPYFNSYSLFSYGTSVIANSGNMGTFISTDNGLNWGSLIGSLSNNYWVGAIGIGDSIICANIEGLGFYLSTNNGTHWSTMKSIKCKFKTTDITGLAVHGSNIFASILDSGVYVSYDKAISWYDIYYGMTTNNVNSIVPDKSNIFAATDKGIFVSTNEGDIWTQLTNKLIDTTDIVNIKISGNNLFALSKNNEFFLSKDYGINWGIVSKDGLPASDIWDITIDSIYIYTGTYGNAVWRRALTDIITGNERPGCRKYETELTAFPNPVEQIINIKSHVQNKSQIQIKIFDITGREVDEIKIGKLRIEDGVNVIKYDAGKLKSGVYFVKLLSENCNCIVKFIKE